MKLLTILVLTLIFLGCSNGARENCLKDFAEASWWADGQDAEETMRLGAKVCSGLGSKRCVSDKRACLKPRLEAR